MGLIALGLTGCGSSTEEEQLAWLDKWNGQYKAKITMFNVCYREAGVYKGAKHISKSQKKVVHACQFAYMTEQADNDGVILDRELLENNVIQF